MYVCVHVYTFKVKISVMYMHFQNGFVTTGALGHTHAHQDTICYTHTHTHTHAHTHTHIYIYR